MYTWVYHCFHNMGDEAEIAPFFLGSCILIGVYLRRYNAVDLYDRLTIFVSQQVVPQLESKTDGDQDGTWERPL